MGSPNQERLGRHKELPDTGRKKKAEGQAEVQQTNDTKPLPGSQEPSPAEVAKKRHSVRVPPGTLATCQGDYSLKASLKEKKALQSSVCV